MIYVKDGDKRIPILPDNVVGVCRVCGKEFAHDIFSMMDECPDADMLDVDICDDCAKELWTGGNREQLWLSYLCGVGDLRRTAESESRALRIFRG